MIDLESGEVTEVGSVPSTDFEVSPDGSQISFTRHANGLNDHVFLADLEQTDEAEKIGVGRNPHFAPDGEAIAVVATIRDYSICPLGETDPDAKGCRPGERVSVYDIAGGSGSGTALGANIWRFIGWTGDERVLAASLESKFIALGYVGADFEDVQQFIYPPGEIRAASPVVPTLLLQQDVGIFIQELNLATPLPGVKVPFTKETTVRSAKWSPDGSWIAAVTQEGNASEVVLIGAADGEATPIREKALDEAPVWSVDGTTFAFMTRDEQGQALVTCSPPDTCRTTQVDAGTEVLALR